MSDTVTIDNLSAGRAGDELPARPRPPADWHRSPARSIFTTGRGRYEGMLAGDEGARARARARAMCAPASSARTRPIPAARSLLQQPNPPSALYVASGVMALGVMRAIADLGLRCPEDISIASTDTIPGIGGLRPRLTRTEHPVGRHDQRGGAAPRRPHQPRQRPPRRGTSSSSRP